jgi:hypothetical protein
VAFALDRVLPTASGTMGALGRAAGLVVCSMGALVVTDALGRRFLPLATLLQLSLVFPDPTPSRFKTALKGGSGRRLAREIETARRQGLSDEPTLAAEQLLMLATAMGDHDRRTRGHETHALIDAASTLPAAPSVHTPAVAVAEAELLAATPAPSNFDVPTIPPSDQSIAGATSGGPAATSDHRSVTDHDSHRKNAAAADVKAAKPANDAAEANDDKQDAKDEAKPTNDDAKDSRDAGNAAHDNRAVATRVSPTADRCRAATTTTAAPPSRCGPRRRRPRIDCATRAW